MDSPDHPQPASQPASQPAPAPTDAPVMVLGEGVLSWPNMERVSDRYGVVDLLHDPHGDDCVIFEEITTPMRGALVAVLLDVLDEWPFQDQHGLGASYQRPAVNEPVVLGAGTLFTEEFASMHGDRPGRVLAGVRPDDGREERWLDPAALGRVHHQRVRLEFHPEGQGEERPAGDTASLGVACTTNRHDDGLDIVAGTAITGTQVGRVSWDAADGGGYVLRVGDLEWLPEDIDDVVAKLASQGWRLTPESREEVISLRPETR